VSLARFGALGALLGLVPMLAAAQGFPAGVVAGTVAARSDTGAVMPASGAVVSIIGSSLNATTDSAGRFVIGGVPVGPQAIRVTLAGYRVVNRGVRVPEGDTVRVAVTLQSDAQVLSPVRTVAKGSDAEAFASKPNVGTIAMGAAAMAGVPSVGEPDVVRVAQLLPGVVARNDFNTGLNVRGGEADQNLVLLDGYPIYNPFHFGGVFSTFMDATVGGIELMTAALPARYGGRLSSVLDVRSAEETRPGVHASADISALGTSARFAGTFDAGRGTWSVAGRRTYADAVTTVFTNDIFPYHFHDLHAHASWSLPSNVRLTLTAYEGRDVLDANLAEFASDSVASKAGRGEWAFDWGNRVLGATIAKDLGPEARIPVLGLRLGESTTLEQRVAASGFSTVLDLGDGAFSQRSRIGDVSVSGSLLARGASHDRSAGYELATHRIRYASGSTQTGTTDFDLVQSPGSAAAWIDDLWRVSPRWIVEGGLRAEALTVRKWRALSPRASVKFFASDKIALTAGVGRVTQWQHSLAGDGPLRYFEIWIASDSAIPVATAWHYVTGLERLIGSIGTVKLEAYYKRYDRVLEANWSEDPSRHGDEFFATEGKSYGVDLLARIQPPNGLGGWIAYTYGVSSRWRDTLHWAPGHDRRHNLNVVATWRRARYRYGARLGYATGSPYTPIVGEIARRTYDPSRDHWGTGDPQRFIESLGGARNSARFPPSHRLDLDASREYKVRGATVVPYVSVLNTFNSKNVFAYVYHYSTNPPTRRAISQFPVLPSLGVRVDF
jgi:hypothetical protein